MIRCHAHFQGDKCRLSIGHDGSHESPLHSWNTGDKIDEIRLPSLKAAEKDWRKLLAMGGAIRRRFWPMYLHALKNCEEFMKEASRVRNERSFKRHQRKAESPLEGAQA